MRILLVIFCACFQFLPCETIVTYRLVHGNISTSEKGTCIDPFYKIKAINRYTTSWSGGCGRLTRTITSLYVSSIVEYKRNFGNYRQLMNVRRLELCSPSTSSHPFFKFFRQWIIPKELVKDCPLKEDDFRMYNLTYKPDAISVWPDGYYKLSATLEDDLDDGIFKSTTILKVTNVDNVREFK